MEDQIIKVCPKCAAEFRLHDIIDDPEIAPIGMQFVGMKASLNKYYFNHRCDGCGTTFTVAVTEFAELIEEPIPDDDFTGTPQCKEYCHTLSDLSECHAECRYAPFRRYLINVLVKWKKGTKQDSPTLQSLLSGADR